MSLGTEIAIVILLVLLNGFFAMSELAIVSARRGLLRQLAEDDHKGAQLVLDMGADPSSFLSIVQIGMTLNSILAGAFSGATLAGRLGVYLDRFDWIAPNGEVAALALTVAGVTYLNLVIGELVPKRIGLAYAETISVRVAHVMSIMASIIAPIVWVLKASTELLLRIMHLHAPKGQGITEEEIKDIIAEGAESGALKPAEKKMLEGVMRLADRTVRSIMTPRIDMVWLSSDATPHEHKEIIRSSGYSRFPVARGDMEEVLGVVYAKDLLNASFDGPTLSLKPVMRLPLMVPDSTPVLRLLDQFKKSGQHIAIVVDEYGSVEGLVSITDMIESVTGELPEKGRNLTYIPERREDGTWVFDAMTPIDEVEAVLSSKDMRGDGHFQTLAGFVIHHLGHLPTIGDNFELEGTSFTVDAMHGRRVDRVIVKPAPEDTEDD